MHSSGKSAQMRCPLMFLMVIKYLYNNIKGTHGKNIISKSMKEMTLKCDEISGAVMWENEHVHHVV